MAHELFSGYSANAKLQAGKLVIREVSEQGTDAVMPAMAAIHTKAEMTEGQGDVIIDDENFLGFPAIEAGHGADRTPTLIHVGEWLDEGDIVQPGNVGDAGLPFGGELEFRTGALDEEIEDAKADIVPGLEVFVPGISESDDGLDAHGINLLWSANDTDKKTPAARRRQVFLKNEFSGWRITQRLRLP